MRHQHCTPPGALAGCGAANAPSCSAKALPRLCCRTMQQAPLPGADLLGCSNAQLAGCALYKNAICKCSSHTQPVQLALTYFGCASTTSACAARICIELCSLQSTLSLLCCKACKKSQYLRGSLTRTEQRIAILQHISNLSTLCAKKFQGTGACRTTVAQAEHRGRHACQRVRKSRFMLSGSSPCARPGVRLKKHRQAEAGAQRA